MIPFVQSAVFAVAPKGWEPPRDRFRRGFTLIEIIFGVAFSAFLGAVIITSLMNSQRFAARARLLTNARAIVQRNIDAASGVAFSASAPPPILAITASGGEICDDDGGTGTPVENIQVLRSGTNVLVSGTLRRIVTAEPVIVTGTTSDASVVVRRVTFQIDYDYLSIHYTHSETTLRSSDLQ
ncbi:MAG: type II secretion system protein [Verrucomicrobia bacterium]|nr:type II secretion system protein [Verrucomicrobiota bacterium]